MKSKDKAEQFIADFTEDIKDRDIADFCTLLFEYCANRLPEAGSIDDVHGIDELNDYSVRVAFMKLACLSNLIMAEILLTNKKVKQQTSVRSKEMVFLEYDKLMEMMGKMVNRLMKFRKKRENKK